MSCCPREGCGLHRLQDAIKQHMDAALLSP